MNRFEQAADAAVPQLGATALRGLAERIAAGWPDHAILAWIGQPHREPATFVLAARDDDQRTEQAAYLRGLAAGHGQQLSTVVVETVWSGPSSHSVPIRATAQALVEVINSARHELLLMTYSATPRPDIRTALTDAIARAVEVTAVVETLQGAGSALASAEPAAAFAGIPGLKLFHWPVRQRSEPGAKMHAKLAVADRSVLLISSANLTQSGVAKNIEAGLLVHGGTAPQRTAEHIAALKASGALRPLDSTDGP